MKMKKNNQGEDDLAPLTEHDGNSTPVRKYTQSNKKCFQGPTVLWYLF